MRGFFETCINANQELIVRLRKSSSSPLDLYSHINQYVRSFNAPIVPNIKVEPSNYLVKIFLLEEKYLSDEKYKIVQILEGRQHWWSR